MMAAVQPFYVADAPDRFTPTPSTAGPWGPDSQHGGPPAALLARAVEALPLPHVPADGSARPPPANWSPGYLDAMEWRWITGAVTEPI